MCRGGMQQYSYPHEQKRAASVWMSSAAQGHGRNSRRLRNALSYVDPGSFWDALLRRRVTLDPELAGMEESHRAAEYPGLEVGRVNWDQIRTRPRSSAKARCIRVSVIANANALVYNAQLRE